MKQQTCRQTNEAVQVHSHFDSTAAHTINRQQDDQTTINETQTKQTEVIDWSIPDSLGRQYPVRTTTTSTTTCRGQQNVVTTTVSQSCDVQTTATQEASQTIEQQEQIQTNSAVKTKTTTPSWLICLILGVIATATIINNCIKTLPNNMSVTVSSCQSLFDLAVQYTGTAQTALEWAMLNGISLTEDLQVGQQLTPPDVTDQQVVLTFQVGKLIPASSITQSQILEVLDQQEGIDFWGIEYDFIVQ